MHRKNARASAHGFLRIDLPVVFEPRAKWVVVGTPALDLWTQGENMETAKKRLEELVIGFLDECLKDGTLFQVLNDCGFEAIEVTANGEAVQAEAGSFGKQDSECEHLRVALPLLQSVSKRGARCHE